MTTAADRWFIAILAAVAFTLSMAILDLEPETPTRYATYGAP